MITTTVRPFCELASATAGVTVEFRAKESMKSGQPGSEVITSPDIMRRVRERVPPEPTLKWTAIRRLPEILLQTLQMHDITMNSS